MKKAGIWILALGIVLWSGRGWTEDKYKVTPSLSLKHMYSDNITLEPENEISDNITMISPGIGLNGGGPTWDFEAQYTPTWVRYWDNSKYDTVRHSGNANLNAGLDKNWTFRFTDSYRSTEEALNPESGNLQVRRSGETYQTNTAAAQMDVVFGEKDHASAGVRHRMSENEDETLDDAREINPFARVTYWFNTHNGLELGYNYTSTTFDRDDGPPTGDDTISHRARASYIRQVTRHTRADAAYEYSTRDFDGNTADYSVHNLSVGVSHIFTARTSGEARMGVYRNEEDGSEDTDGFLFNLSLNHSLKRGKLSLSAQNGWDEDYMEARGRGFTRFTSFQGSVNYTLAENLDANAQASFRKNKNLDDIEDQTVQAGCGLGYTFMRWYTLGVDLLRRERTSDNLDDEYVDNRASVSFSVSRPFDLN